MPEKRIYSKMTFFPMISHPYELYFLFRQAFSASILQDRNSTSVIFVIETSRIKFFKVSSCVTSKIEKVLIMQGEFGITRKSDLIVNSGTQRE